MMVRHEERITTSQTAVIITNFLLGTGILTLPRTSVEEVGTPDVWITLVLGGLVALLAAVIMVKLNHQYPDKTFYEFSQDIIGKWIGSLISLLFASYLLAHSGFQVRSMLEIIRFFYWKEPPLGHCHGFFMGRIILDRWRFKFDRQVVPNRAPHYIHSFSAGRVYEYRNF